MDFVPQKDAREKSSARSYLLDVVAANGSEERRVVEMTDENITLGR